MASFDRHGRFVSNRDPERETPGEDWSNLSEADLIARIPHASAQRRGAVLRAEKKRPDGPRPNVLAALEEQRGD